MTAATAANLGNTVAVNVVLIAIRAACHYYAHETSEFIDCGRAGGERRCSGRLAVTTCRSTLIDDALFLLFRASRRSSSSSSAAEGGGGR